MPSRRNNHGGFMRLLRRHTIWNAVLLAFAGCGAAAPAGDLAIRSPDRPTGETPVAVATDWPSWRGPNGDGVARDVDVPTTWSTTEHIRWQSPVPGRGHASPIVCGNRIFLSTADEEKQQHRLLAYDRSTGEPLWNILVHDGGFMHKHEKNSYASATPACDGEHIFATFLHDGAIWVSAVTLDGQIVWQVPAGPFTAEHGDSASPVFYKSAILVGADNLETSFVAALDRATGRILWRTPRESPGRHGSYGCPILATLAGRPQFLYAGHGYTASYDPDTGNELWKCTGPAECTGTTLAASADLAFASGGFPEHSLLAIRGDGSGDVTATNVAWQTHNGVTYVPSPVCHDGRLYVINETGVATCFDAASGSELWHKRLSGPFTASPIIAGGKLFITNEAGATFILAAGEKYELLATNDLASPVMATPAICGRQIFLRTADKLYCIE
jgi:outer membrane protein assembly factor BamB